MPQHDSKDFFHGKRVLVTGASRGIGKGIAIHLSKLGAEVFGLGQSPENLQLLKQECPEIHIVCADVAKWDETRKAVEKILPIDLLVNNAGVSGVEAFVDLTEATYDKVMDVNLKSVINISQVVAKSLLERKTGGSIVNISSICGHVTFRPNLTSYHASKAAVDAVTRCMALELGKHDIRVNSVNPGVIPTDMTTFIRESPEFYEPLFARQPISKFGDVDDIAEAVAFLLSDKSKYITGITLPVDGGYLST